MLINIQLIRLETIKCNCSEVKAYLKIFNKYYLIDVNETIVNEMRTVVVDSLIIQGRHLTVGSNEKI